MFRLNISDSMIRFIKDTREKYKITASELAVKINKSSAYLSKFDKGDYKSISYEELCFMLNQICGNEDEGKELVDNFLTNYILNDATEDELNEDHGLTTYDKVFRFIEIPSDLIDFINGEISKNKLAISDIVKKANENADLPPEFVKNPKYEANIYYPYEKEDLEDQSKTSSDVFIKVKLEEFYIEDILNKEITITNYHTLQAVLYTIYRLQNKYEKNLSTLATITILDKFHFNNLTGIRYGELAKKRKIKIFDEMEDMPSLFVNAISNFSDIIYTFFNQNPIYVISKIGGFHKNLYTDPSFIIAMLNLPFYKMKVLDRDDKKKFIEEIEQLILKYSEKKPDDKFETY